MKSANVADELMESLAEMAAHAQGDGPALTVRTVDVPDVDVQAVRKGLGMKRPEFCRRFGLDPRAVQDWEQKRRRPDRAARALLLVIKHSPDVVEAALNSAA